MTEPEILEAYEALSSPTNPPADLLERVDRRIRRRRTTRKAVAGVAALAVAGAIGVATLGGDGTDGDTQVADDPGGTERSTLTYTNTDGSTYTFEAKDIGIGCATNKRGDARTPTQVLTLTGNAMLAAASGGDAPPEEAFTGPVLHVELLVDEVDAGQVFDLPFENSDGSSDTRVMTFFFTNGVDEDSNELSSAEPESSGTVTVHEATCGPTPSLWIEIDGTVGSEVQQEPLAMTGEYRS